MNAIPLTEETLSQWAKELGFQKLGISDIELSTTESYLNKWLAKKFHGDMEWMQRHGTKRTRPDELEPETISIISVRMNYRPAQEYDPIMVLNHPELAYISRYALGRDYHKMMRKRLQKLAVRIQQNIDNSFDENNNTSIDNNNDSKTKPESELKYRVFVDSAPVMEKPIAQKAGLGWVGKHTNILSDDAGSWFFLGEIYTNLPLTPSKPIDNHCGDCTACINICPTKAIIKPYELDARRCISYLTIEHKTAIPEEFRKAIGNRIYGCDDCQLVCPWNRFAQDASQVDFSIRDNLDTAHLLDLFDWSEEKFLKKMEGSPIRRMGHEKWIRNIAIALGNAPKSETIIKVLKERYETSSELVREHIQWALDQ